MPTAFDFVKKNVRSAASAIPSMIDQGRTDLANQQVAANNAAMQAPIQAPEVKAPSNPAQDALNNEMLGRLMRPGRGRRKGQMVTSGGKYSGRTVDEIYGKLQKSGSGAGGGLRTGSLSEGSGIDWLKANRTSGKALARQEANVGATGDRFKAAPKKVARPAMTQAPSVVDTKPMNMASAVPVSPQVTTTNPPTSPPSGLDVSGVSKLYKKAEAAVNSPEYKQRQQDRSVAPFMQGAMAPQKPFSAPGQQSPKRTPEPAWGPIKQPNQPSNRWAEQMRQNVDSATTPKPGIADTFLNLPAPTASITWKPKSLGLSKARRHAQRSSLNWPLASWRTTPVMTAVSWTVGGLKSLTSGPCVSWRTSSPNHRAKPKLVLATTTKCCPPAWLWRASTRLLHTPHQWV